uniref:Putative collagen alpha-1i chain n=1 Tax=Ixodes ricinus TaxID=34613 RepID=A0A147BDY5_IXORI
MEAASACSSTAAATAATPSASASASSAAPHVRAKSWRWEGPPDDAWRDVPCRFALPLGPFTDPFSAHGCRCSEPPVSCSSPTLTRPRASAPGPREPPDPGVARAAPHRPQPTAPVRLRPLRSAHGPLLLCGTHGRCRAVPAPTAPARGRTGRCAPSDAQAPRGWDPHDTPAHTVPDGQGPPGPLRPDARHSPPGPLGDLGLSPALPAGPAGGTSPQGGQAAPAGGPLRRAPRHPHAGTGPGALFAPAGLRGPKGAPAGAGCLGLLRVPGPACPSPAPTPAPSSPSPTTAAAAAAAAVPRQAGVLWGPGGGFSVPAAGQRPLRPSRGHPPPPRWGHLPRGRASGRPRWTPGHGPPAAAGPAAAADEEAAGAPGPAAPEAPTPVAAAPRNDDAG